MLNRNHRLAAETHQKLLLVPQEVSKVDVEQVARGGHHDVVIVTVTYALCGGKDHVTVM